ncbi:MAG TPA: Gfo/Idh/MocA family oxidoreductase [Candidatus Altiarchaeales archaeon]|nr:Gfo/Idh/MocA family oxidoreductase [Candidatus Altiarchaeales archaeon]
MDKIGIGVIGCGSIAELAHFPSIKRAKNVELIAVCDTNEEIAKRAKEKWGAKAWYTDYEKMLKERDDLKAVVIASPPKFHCEQGIACAEKGLHLLIEKPLAVTNKEAWDIVNTAKENKVKLMVGCDRRFWPQNQWAKNLIEEGVIGKVMMGRATMHEHVKFYQENIAFTDFRLHPEIAGGSAVSDTGAHAIDLLIWLIGSPVKRVIGIADRRVLDERRWGKCDDTAVIMMEHENGALGYVSCNRFSPVVSQFTEVYGDEGTIFTSSDAQNPYQTAPLAVYTTKDYEYEDLPEIIRKYRWPQIFWAEDLITHPVSKRWVSIYPPREPNNYFYLCQHFIDCIVNDKEPLTKGEDGAQAVEVMCAVFKSMETKGWVDLPLEEEVVPPYYKPERRK